MKPRALLGIVIGLGGLLGTAAVLLAGGGKKGAAAAPQPVPGTPPGVPLTTGRVLDVGLVSGIPTVRPFDSGPINYDHNAPGWDYAVIGGRL